MLSFVFRGQAPAHTASLFHAGHRIVVEARGTETDHNSVDIRIHIRTTGTQQIPPEYRTADTQCKTQYETHNVLARGPVSRNNQENEQYNRREHADQSDPLALLDRSNILATVARFRGIDVIRIHENERGEERCYRGPRARHRRIFLGLDYR